MLYSTEAPATDTRVRAPARLWIPALWCLLLTVASVFALLVARGSWPGGLYSLLVAVPFASAVPALLVSRADAQARIRAEVQRTAAAGVLHDLRGPLLTVRSYLDMLADGGFGVLPPEAREAAERAAVAAARAQALADALGGGTVAVQQVERVDLDELLGEVFVALGAEITAAGASIEMDALPAVTGERQALYRVFANLVENAVKYSGTGAPRVVVSASADGERARIAVRDWGVGIPPAERRLVFEPHVRGSSATGRAGQGLGLATVRELVRAQGGEVSIAADVTDGTCVEVWLPRA
jgi:signal transduction histidine kinase